MVLLLLFMISILMFNFFRIVKPINQKNLQIDVRGDAYGLLAAHPVTPLVSLHHLDSVNPLFPGQTRLESLQTLIQAYRVDPDQTLQQSFCHDRKRKWSVSIAWGYTAQIYPSLLAAKDLAMPMRTFKTWRSWSNGPFTFNTRPVNSDPCQQPIIYFLDEVEEVGQDQGQTLTTYKVNLGEPQKKCGSSITSVQRIVVLASKMDPQELVEVILFSTFLYLFMDKQLCDNCSQNISSKLIVRNPICTKHIKHYVSLSLDTIQMFFLKCLYYPCIFPKLSFIGVVFG